MPAQHCCCRRRRWRLLTSHAAQHGKAGGFIDRRFGETDASTDADEKALQRMQRLRQMQFGKASRFALAGVSQRRSEPHCRARPLTRWCASQMTATRRFSPTSAARLLSLTPTTLCRQTGCAAARWRLREQAVASAHARKYRMRMRSSTTSLRASTTSAVDSSRRSSVATVRRPRTALRTLPCLRNPRKK